MEGISIPDSSLIGNEAFSKMGSYAPQILLLDITNGNLDDSVLYSMSKNMINLMTLKLKLCYNITRIPVFPELTHLSLNICPGIDDDSLKDISKKYPDLLNLYFLQSFYNSGL